uniref:Uncharacterized protein n=1 Tax=Rhizophora mucronata TaxID=61149 RepID=A0A2P2PJ95_RHIMU
MQTNRATVAPIAKPYQEQTDCGIIIFTERLPNGPDFDNFKCQ